MKKQSMKYFVLVLFTAMIVVSVILVGSVKINYNISDYLDDETETKISLKIMEDEFGTTGNIQVMVKDVTIDEAQQISAIIKSVPNVLLVNFSGDDPNYYKDGDALFAVIVDGDEYSASAAEVLDGIKAGLDQHFSGKTNYGGAVVEKIEMRNTMKKEIVVILAISILFAMAIMLIMATSWLEPVVLLISCGVAVIINMGTNVVFGEISYITNAVAAILQLALSVDYSIVLLHNFRALKKEMPNKERAMMKAVKITFKPVLASAATTVAGLLALLFMTMKIGFDIGIVLTKGIAISMITALTLLPALLLVFDKLMEKTSKRDLVLSGKKFCNIALKGGKVILLVGFALIIACGGLQLQNIYSFTDSANPNEDIINTFGSNNTIVVVYPNNREDWDKEGELAQMLAGYKTADGKTPLQNYTAYSNTVREIYSIEMAAKKLNIPQSDVERLFKMYHDYNNDASNRKLSPYDFVEYSIEVMSRGDDSVGNFADESTLNTLKTLLAIHEIVNNSHTADEIYTLVSTGVMSGTGLTRFQIRQMYGLYLWDEFENDTVSFEEMLYFIVGMTTDEDGKTLMDEQTITDLTELANGLNEFKTQMNAEVTREEFREFGHEKFGEESWVDAGCDIIFGLASKGGTAKIVDVLRLVDRVSALIPPNYRALIENYTYVYDILSVECPYTEFAPRLKNVVLALTNDEEREVNAEDTAIQQAYIMYYDKLGAIPEVEIPGIEFIQFVNDTIVNNPTVSGNVGEDGKLKLQDVMLVDEYISDTNEYNCEEMTQKLMYLQSNVKSLASSETSLSGAAISGIYFMHVDENSDLPTDPIMAADILNFVVDNMNNPNHALYKAMTDEHKAKVEERKQAIVSAEKLFLGDNYNRMLISVDLPNESEESSKFVNELITMVKEVYGPNAHVAGQMVSTWELQNTFDKDNQIISIFTIISIFLVIAIVFKSISLPVVLVAIIQGAIWIAMSMSLITGPIFFMSYIIATCILMGSTIDYGILMSTNYLEYRKTMDKKEALYSAVKSAMPTIFTSGLILIICGFIVGLVASMTSISTVGFLLGRGTLVSVLMITLVLPSILYVLDGFILKLTHKGIKRKNKEK